MSHLCCCLCFFSLLNTWGYEESFNFGQFITVIIVTLSVLTLPTSLFVLPILAGFKYGLELEPDSLFAVYLYLGVLNIVGFVQWFKLMPDIFRHEQTNDFADDFGRMKEFLPAEDAE